MYTYSVSDLLEQFLLNRRGIRGDLIFVVESIGITVSRFSQTFTNQMQITAFRSRVRNNTNHLDAVESRYSIPRGIILLKIPDLEELYIQRH